MVHTYALLQSNLSFIYKDARLKLTHQMMCLVILTKYYLDQLSTSIFKLDVTTGVIHSINYIQ